MDSILNQSSDELLLQLIAQRDVGALEILYDRYAQGIYNLILRIVREPTLAEELLQETFWQLWQVTGQGQFSSEEVVTVWLCRLARNKSLDQLRQLKTHPQPLAANLNNTGLHTSKQIIKEYPAMEVMRILLVDDHILFRKGIASLILSRKDLKVVGEADDGVEALKLAREARPDVILMDVTMPNLSGLEALNILTEEMPHVAIVMLTIADDDDILFQAIKNGAKGYLLKNMEPQELYRMLDKVRQGEAAISGAMAAKILRELMTPPSSEKKQQSRVDQLTAREIMVLEEVVKGVNNKEIADTLNITENTVKVHLSNILGKLHLQNRTQAAVHAVREGLVNDSPDLYQ